MLCSKVTRVEAASPDLEKEVSEDSGAPRELLSGRKLPERRLSPSAPLMSSRIAWRSRAARASSCACCAGPIPACAAASATLAAVSAASVLDWCACTRHIWFSGNRTAQDGVDSGLTLLSDAAYGQICGYKGCHLSSDGGFITRPKKRPIRRRGFACSRMARSCLLSSSSLTKRLLPSALEHSSHAMHSPEMR